MLAVIQARMSSRRLPGKVLLPIAGTPMLRRVYDRVSQADGVSRVVVSTSTSDSDDPLWEFCEKQELPIHRGSLDDVAARLLDCARTKDATEFIRISADSPMIDPSLITKAISLQKTTSCDLSTNVQFRSFPKGQSVEVIRTESLGEAWKSMSEQADREHVTALMYRQPTRFTIRNFSSGEELGRLQLSVDTVGDLERAEDVVQALGEHFSWREAAAHLWEPSK